MTQPKKPALNLICNGMMLFNEKQDRLQVVVPKPLGHVRRFNWNPEPTQDTLEELPIGTYSIDIGRSGKSIALRDLIDPSDYVVLDGSKVNFNETEAIRTCAVIEVPMPDIIRLYRPSIPDNQKRMLGNCYDKVLRVPSVIHDIVVLSYSDIKPGQVVTLRTKDNEILIAVKFGKSRPINWMVYSNEEHSLLEAADDIKDHPTTVNDFLSLKTEQSAKAPEATDLKLSGGAPKDGPPTTTPLFITPRQLALFHELSTAGKDFKLLSGEPACSGAAIANRRFRSKLGNDSAGKATGIPLGRRPVFRRETDH